MDGDSDDSEKKSMARKIEINKSQDNWMDDANMVTEIEKTSEELKTRVTLADEKNEIDDTGVGLSAPLCTSDVQSEVKDNVKYFEQDGTTYCRKYKRKIKLEKHKFKQVITLPSGEDNKILDFDTSTNDVAGYKNGGICTDVLHELNTKPLSTTVDEKNTAVKSPKIIIRNKFDNCTEKFDDAKFQISESNIINESTYNSEITNFTRKFGYAPEISEEMFSINSEVESSLRSSFIRQWNKIETELNVTSSGNKRHATYCNSTSTGSTGKAKTISLVDRFNNVSSQGNTLYSSTCVQMTRSLVVRQKEESSDRPKQNYPINIPVISTRSVNHGSHKSNNTQLPVTFEEVQSIPIVNQTPEYLFMLDVSRHLQYNDKYNPKAEDNTSQHSISAGHLDVIIAHACSIQHNTTTDYPLFHSIFITTYHLFISTDALLEKLVLRYKHFNELDWLPSNNNLAAQLSLDDNFDSSDAESLTSLKRSSLNAIIKLMIEIINMSNRVLPETVTSQLNDFLIYLNGTGSLKRSMIIESALRDHNNRLVEIEYRKKTFSEGKSDAKQKNPPKSLLDMDSGVVAQQITMMESQVIDQVQLEDLILFKTATCNEQLMNCVHFFNRLTFWVKTQLYLDPKSSNTLSRKSASPSMALNPDKPANKNYREKLIVKFIEILENLLEHQNFSSYSAFLYALDDYPEKHLSKKTIEKLKEHSEFISYLNGNHRKSLVVNAKHCFIPLLGDVFSLLARTNEIMPNMITNPEGGTEKLVNFKKMFAYFSIIQPFIKKLQASSEDRYYKFELNPIVLEYLNDFQNHYSEDELYSLKENLNHSKPNKKTESASGSSKKTKTLKLKGLIQTKL